MARALAVVRLSKPQRSKRLLRCFFVVGIADAEDAGDFGVALALGDLEQHFGFALGDAEG